MDDIQRLILYLVLVLHVARTTDSLLCGSEFTDVQSRAALAPIVLQAKVDFTFERKNNNRFNVSIGISKIIRGSIGDDLLRTGGGASALGRIRVGEFGPQDDSACLTERQSLIMGGHKFIFFLKRSPEQGYYTQSSLPVQSSKTVLRSIRKILCNGCVQPASIRHSNKLVRKTVEEGSRVRLRCRVRGAPTPLVIWMKDEKVLRRRKAMRIRNMKKSSILRLRRVRLRDAGRYVCISRNIAGQARKEFYLSVTPAQTPDHSTSTLSPSTSSSSSSSSSTSLSSSSSSSSSVTDILDTSSSSSTSSVQTTPSPEEARSTPRVPMSGHYYPCEEQTYCLNGGVCVYLPDYDVEHCRCPANYMGKRCEIRDIFTLLKEITNRESLTHQRRLFTIVGIVTFIIFIILLFICCYAYRRCRSRKRKRELVTSSEETPLSYMALAPGRGLDTADGAQAVYRMNSETQTDPIDLALFIPSYQYMNHAPRGHSVDVHERRPSPPSRDSTRRPGSRPSEPRGRTTERDPFPPPRAGSFRLKRDLGQARETPSPARSKESSPHKPLQPLPERFKPIEHDHQSEASSRLPTPNSRTEFLGVRTPELSTDAVSQASHEGESRASILSIDMYDSSQVISDLGMSEISDSDADLHSVNTDLISDIDRTDLDEKLLSVPVMFNGLHSSPAPLKKSVPISANGDTDLRFKFDRL